jgi:adenosylcobinamide-GDP ribazoletransferase
MSLDGPLFAVTLLTVMPLRRQVTPDRRIAGAAMLWAPAVGLLLGIVAAAALYVAGRLDGSLTAAAVAVAAVAGLTRGLHLDGLADLADGLGSGKPAAGALEVMRKSDIGPFGVAAITLTLLIQVAALAQAGTGRDGVAGLIAAVVTGRLAITWACRSGVPAARGSGLGVMVAQTVRPAAAAIVTGVAVAAGIALASAGVIRPVVPVAVAAGLGAAWLLERHAVRRLGGVTGDVLGALCETATTVCLLVVAARG